MLPPYAAKDRITDEAMRADFNAIERLQGRPATLNRSGTVPTSNYHWSKAQCWLDMARHNYHENDRTGTIESALAQSVGLIKALESKAATAMDTVLIPERVKLRDDLWGKARGPTRATRNSAASPRRWPASKCNWCGWAKSTRRADGAMRTRISVSPNRWPQDR